MESYEINLIPKTVEKIDTSNRKIVTPIPVPESIEVFEKLAEYEARSMHGQLPVLWDKAEGFNVYDKYGNKWIDFTSTIFVANAGHGNPDIISAIKKYLDKPLLHTYTFANEARAQFLEKLAEIGKPYFNKSFLLSSGTEATECAVKIMRMHGQKIRKNKTGIISFEGAMHGRTMGAQMLKGTVGSEWIGYKDPNIFHLPFPFPWENDSAEFDWGKKLNNDIETLMSDGMKISDLCGIIVESYLGWGAIFYPDDYIKALYKFAKKNNLLVCFDEIQGGIARSGKMFIFEHYGVEPDLICLGKGLSSSLPLSAVLGKQEYMDIPAFGSMSSTHSGNPLCCAAGLANLNYITENNLIYESERKGMILHKRLGLLKEKYKNRIIAVCGKGLVASIIMKKPGTEMADSVFPSMVCEMAMQKGLLLVYTGRESIKIGPPLTISDNALNEGFDVIEECFSEISKII